MFSRGRDADACACECVYRGAVEHRLRDKHRIGSDAVEGTLTLTLSRIQIAARGLRPFFYVKCCYVHCGDNTLLIFLLQVCSCILNSVQLITGGGGWLHIKRRVRASFMCEINLALVPELDQRTRCRRSGESIRIRTVHRDRICLELVPP